MPRFYRNSRALLRLFLALVLGMALFGWWYADTHWRLTAADLDVSAVTEEVDWLDLTAGLIEDGIEIFQSATSDDQ